MEKQNRCNFTKKTLEAIAPTDRRIYYYDTKVSGLTISVTPSGVKSFVVYKKLNGKPLRVTLGRFPELSVEQARKKAIKTLSEIADGVNPIQRSRALRQRGLSLEEVFSEYLRSRQGKLSRNTVSNYWTILNTHLLAWKNKPLQKISRDLVETKHRELSEISPTSANKTFRLVRAIFNFAHGKYEDENGVGLYPDNPVTRLTHTKSWNQETRRQKKIKNSEMPQWFSAVRHLGQSGSAYDETAADYFLFIIFNGLRRREAASLKFSDVDFTEGCFSVAKTKNGKSLVLPITTYTKQLLRKRQKVCSSEYVFPGIDSITPINDPRRQLAQVRESSGVYFTLHDLRRTFISMAEASDVSAYALKMLVNHSVGTDVTAGYVVMDWERLAGPLQAIGDRIAEHGEIRLSDLGALSSNTAA